MSDIRIACVGDVMCGDSFSKLGWGTASCIDRHGVGFLPDEITRLFKTHDLVLCNVECVLSDIGRRERSLRSLHMRGRARTAEHLADWGITAAHLANNHILEHGREAARDTANNLEKAGIRVVGAGPDNGFEPGVTATRLAIGGKKLSVIGACFHPGGYAFCPGSIEQVLAKVKAESGAGQLVIVSAHWGDELIDRPNLWQRITARRLMQAGARLVIGHHAHVVQGIDAGVDGMVAYSLGNFIFDSDSGLMDWSVILSVSLSDTAATGHEVIPVVWGEDFRPFVADETRAQMIHREVARRNGLAAEDPEDVAQYEAVYQTEVRALDRRLRQEMWRYLFTHWLRYKCIFWPQILLRPVQRRIGTW